MKVNLVSFPVEEDILPCAHWKHYDTKVLSKVIMSSFVCDIPMVQKILDKWSMPEGSIETFVKGCPMAKFCKYRE